LILDARQDEWLYFLLVIDEAVRATRDAAEEIVEQLEKLSL